MRATGVPLLVILLLAAAPSALRAQARTASPHGELRNRIDCTQCHTAEAWRPLRRDPDFEHRRDAGFPLDGRHASVACAACHEGLRFDRPRAAPDECAVCHRDPHQGRLSTDCALCHDPRGFDSAPGPEAHLRTSFPLTGAHLAVPCEGCHANERDGLFTRLDARCIACHQGDYTRALFPNHAQAGFSITCEDCHRTTRWTGGRFDHVTASGFPLVGAHLRIDCSACHAPPDFQVRFQAASADDCIACHRADYDREHTGMGFSLICTDCHTVERWEGAQFDHDGFFPIYSGRHRGRWDRCQDCHTTTGDFAVFSCTTGCHARNETDGHHEGESGYAYESALCFSCHPRGEAED
jgi:hypothetical protein